MSYSEPAVSVVIPFSPEYTPTEMLADAKRSASNQSVSTEIIVVNDREQQGPGAARNIGLERTKNRYVAFLDADDLWAEDKLSRQLTRMQATGAGLCLDAPQMTRDDFVYELFVGGLNEIMSSVVIDTEQVDTRFEERLDRWEDHLFALEASSAGVCFTQDTFRVRYHDTSLSTRNNDPSAYLRNGKLYVSFVFERIPEAKPFLYIFYKHMYFLTGFYHHQRGDYRRAITYFWRSLQIGISPYPIVGLVGSTMFLLGSVVSNVLREPITQIRHRR
ncbi:MULTISPECIES: glycosyltransferase family 2 protein [Natrialbaceae]|uniref:glycosyltransferase family 2 protein n=1 Tax=Natrialbaceae TaxID=1644061 RepID=UPI00207CB727|nr:glycosyltransferase family 2 protein [Natronococcus sp. CG52]